MQNEYFCEICTDFVFNFLHLDILRTTMVIL